MSRTRSTQSLDIRRRADWGTPITLRPARPGDDPALRRLALLDNRALPGAPYLLAEREGRIDAAISLTDGALVADPFRRTAEICELLRLQFKLRPETLAA